MSVTAHKVEQALDKWIKSQPQVEEEYYNRKQMADFYFDWYGDNNPRVELDGLGMLEFVETTPEDPGDGKYFGSVWKLGNQYFVKDGYYSSWDSSEFDGAFHEVKQAEVKQTVWVSV